MANPMLHRLSSLMASGALSLIGASCATEEIQLEPLRVALGTESPELTGGDQVGATCLTVMNLVADDASYEVRLNGRPLNISGDDQEYLTLRGGSVMFCVGAGDFDLSLVAGGEVRAKTGVISMHAGAQRVFMVRGDRRAPTIAVEEIDMSSPGPGLRRVRVTNSLKEQQPVEVYFYDHREEPQASTGLIAYGDTYEGSIPAELNRWRTALDEEFASGLFAGTGVSRPSDGICLEKPPAGLVLQGLPVTRGASTSFHFQGEFYLQRPLSCTVDTSACPPDRCGFQGW